MFKRSKNKSVTPSHERRSVILENMKIETPADYPVTEYEKRFFLAFEDILRSGGFDPAIITAARRDDGGIRCTVYAGIIGTVHLREQFGSLQYFIDVYKNHNMSDAPVESCIAAIPYWVAYLRKLQHAHKKATTP